ncbi:MAG: trigger factor [Patescibacteria group bacterium]|jgi:FKBP-type peptidyl-prolyl cis-trans isomerase (trigger factor)
MATKDTKTTKKTTQKKENKVVESKLNWLPNKTFELEVTIPWELVAKTYDEVLERTAKNLTLKGFRKGKAPKQMVESYVGKQKLYEQTAQEIVTESYFHAVKQHNLRPIMHPNITPVSVEENKDWKVKAVSCEAPEVKLGNYKEAIKGLKAKSAIWTPEKGKVEEKDQKAAGPTVDQILGELLNSAEIGISEMLLNAETNRMLSNLVDQVNAVGMTVQQYLEANGKEQKQLQQEYRALAEKSLKLEFAIAKVSEENQITVTEKEISEMIENTKDPNVRKQLEQPEQKNYLSLLIRKQKTIDFLKSL